MKFNYFFRSPDSASGGLPLGESDRISIIDTLRGVALLGILLMNIPYFAMPYQIGFNLNVRNEYAGTNYYTWWVINGGFEGTMRALFSMLFGAGCILLLNRLEKKGTSLGADIYYRRLIWLLLFGVINAFIFLWIGDILYHYAVCGLFLFPFRNVKAKHLLLFGFFFMAVSMYKGTSSMYEARSTRLKGEKALALEAKKEKLTEKQIEDKAKYEGMRAKMADTTVRKEAAKEVEAFQGDYLSIMGHVKPWSQKFESTKFYADMFWDIMAFLFFGMALFKWGVLTGQRSKKFYWLLLLGGYGAGLALSYFNLRTMVDIRFDFTRLADHTFLSTYQPRRLLVALGHLSVIMLLYKYGVMKWLQTALAKVGQMAFTNYLSQSIICAFIFYGFGFGLFGKLERYEIYYVVGAIWVFQIIFSNIWLKYYRFGPFEWLWRSLTYWKKQPMKRRTEIGAGAPKLEPETLVVEGTLDSVKESKDSTT